MISFHPINSINRIWLYFLPVMSKSSALLITVEFLSTFKIGAKDSEFLLLLLMSPVSFYDKQYSHSF